ncbi:ankyrin repeat-containing domain, PGG domain protein [Artemisia annua]|uniref:Ankyrin repeat-containing domain, PGG domain protein n=1 Tax=Artemisia annua TaxID=35608 RepID=A0A2U1LEG0_ARTAN|nr:ankyrin repeat-containing domain, PGG domain protein [Artemisia annua]
MAEVKMTNQTVAQSATISVQNPVSQLQQHETRDTVTAASKANTKRLTPNLPCRDLLRAAKAVIDKYPKMELVRYSITENGETALHVAASAKVPKKVEGFVENLVKLMTKEDLALENENYNTALYLAATAGNVKAVKIMVEKNRALLTIPGAGGTMMPLYVAVLFGHYEVAKYLFDNSNGLRDDGWTDTNRGWLLEKCVENDMFDVALEIVKKYPKLGTSGSVLGILARKPEAFPDTEPSITRRTINSIKHLYSLMSITHQSSQSKRPETGTESVSAEHLDEKAEPSPKSKCNIIGQNIKSVFASVGSKVGVCEKKSRALPLLNIIWNEIVQKPKRSIDDILRGPPDIKQYDKPDSGSLDQAFQLQKLISERLKKDYLKIGVPLYEASIKCDWKAAKAVIDKYPKMELVRYSITKNGETALHVAASAKVPKKVEGFVENLVKLMTKEDLALENENYNTALYLAATAGNVKAIKIMVEKNRALLTIPGAGGTMMPLYVAVLFGHYEVAKYLFDNSNGLRDDGWTDTNRGWLLEKCVENDMFDVALEIVKKYPKLGTSGSVLGILARKPEAFPDTEPSITRRTINSIKRLYSLMSITHQPPQSKHPEIGTETVSSEHLDEKAETSPEPKCNIIGRTIKSGKHYLNLFMLVN